MHRDTALVDWDLQDTTDTYVRTVLGTDALTLRQQDPQRAPAVLRATSVALFEHVLAEWRRPGSPCAGALTLYGHDLRLGPGIGLVDALDRPKAGWYALRRLMAPVAVLVTDEGFNGLGVHVVNDGPEDLVGELVLELFQHGEHRSETAHLPVLVPARDARTVDVSLAFGGFRDLSWAHRFGPPAADVVGLSLHDADRRLLARTAHLPAGPVRERHHDLGLHGELRLLDDGTAVAEVRTRAFAQWVTLEVPGWVPLDGWFHLLPGEARTVLLRRTTLPGPSTARPAGHLTAVNARGRVRLDEAR